MHVDNTSFQISPQHFVEQHPDKTHGSTTDLPLHFISGSLPVLLLHTGHNSDGTMFHQNRVGKSCLLKSCCFSRWYHVTKGAEFVFSNAVWYIGLMFSNRACVTWGSHKAGFCGSTFIRVAVCSWMIKSGRACWNSSRRSLELKEEHRFVV